MTINMVVNKCLVVEDHLASIEDVLCSLFLKTKEVRKGEKLGERSNLDACALMAFCLHNKWPMPSLGLTT